MSLRSFSGSSQRHEQDPANVGDTPQMSASNVISDPAADVAKKSISPLTTGKLANKNPIKASDTNALSICIHNLIFPR
ncbi:unnamed protein product [Clonostachys rosea]|uniref:Uncharacterized protein n=1 Tax=Bionectria ochroleuca TaxID=29856 RepID=A0ABY6TZB9_BIOOC|nr:unnamed protein product [Clonostachys rosea]